jgi:hypothetical protein
MTNETQRYLAAIGKALHLVRTGKARLLISVLLYRCWWRLRGLDLGNVSVQELGLETDRSSQHMDGGGPLLSDLLNQMEIVADDMALDIGSGKGGAMATLAQYPFRNVDGVEINPGLVETARRNLARLNLSHCRLFVADATTFTSLDQYTYLFMYNPFPQAVLDHVLSNIEESLRRRPRVLRLIYSNPLHEGAILASGIFSRKLVYEPYAEYRITVYESGCL